MFLLIALLLAAQAQDGDALELPPVVQVEEAPDPLDDLRAVFAEVQRFAGIAVSQAHGVVRLSGTVPTSEARTEAAALAATVPGTRFVDNLLKVDPATSAADQQASRDDSVAARLNGLFGEVNAFRGVQATVDHGVVTLAGQVADQEQRNQAIELAKASPDVVWVEAEGLRTTTDVNARLKPAVEEAWSLLQSLVARIPLLLLGLTVMAVFWVLGSWVDRRISRWTRISEGPMVRSTVARVLRLVIVVVGVLIALELLDATSLVGAVVGTAGVFGLAVGFAFQDIVENYLAGLLLALQQPFAKDDIIEVAGVTGVVVRLTTRNTLLMTLDGNHVFLPNATVFKGALTNFSRNPHRRFDFAVGVGVEENLRDVFSCGLKTLAEMPGVSAEPAPSIRIEALGDSSVIVQVFGWVNQRDHNFLAVRTEAIRRVKEAFDRAGFDLPEPIYRVTMTQVTAVPKVKSPVPLDTAPVVEIRATEELQEQVQAERIRGEEADLLNE